MEQRMYKAACYCRLSNDDLNDGMSVSIETQITLEKKYCRENNIRIVDFYCDDGYTGTNFDEHPNGNKTTCRASSINI